MASDTIIKNIVNEVEKFDQTEQESILAYLRAKRIQKQPRPRLAAHQKPLSMAAIDAVKHKARKDAGK